VTVELGVLILAVAALATLVAAPAVRTWALAAGAVDHPDARRIHASPIARLGGVAVVLAATLALLLAALLSPRLAEAVLGAGGPARWGLIGAAVLVVFLIGTADDLRSMRPRTKLLVELFAALAVVVAAPLPTAVALVPGAAPLPIGAPLVQVLAALWIATVTNALNMTDVADGVASGLAAIAALALAAVTLTLGKVVAPAVLFALSGAMLGFLPHNLRRRLFLGDSGSLAAGFILGSASVVGLADGGTWSILPAALVLGPIVAELVLTLSRRGLAALELVPQGPRTALRWTRPGFFVPDRRHVPHRLLDLGCRPAVMLACVWGFGVVGGGLAIATLSAPRAGLASGLACFALVMVVARGLYPELRWWQRFVARGHARTPVVDGRGRRSTAIEAGGET